MELVSRGKVQLNALRCVLGTDAEVSLSSEDTERDVRDLLQAYKEHVKNPLRHVASGHVIQELAPGHWTAAALRGAADRGGDVTGRSSGDVIGPSSGDATGRHGGDLSKRNDGDVNGLGTSERME